jgi:SAM-dependent methyltransferase
MTTESGPAAAAWDGESAAAAWEAEYPAAAWDGESAAAAWDAEYAAGRYAGEPPVAFVRDILATAREAGLTRGLYIGCGNGRNYLPLVAGGLDLTGLDVSAAAIAQLSARAPDRRDHLVHGDLSVLPAEAGYPLVIGIQVFQHGDRAAAHAHIRAAQRRLMPGGLFCLRVNATATDVWPGHEVTEQHPDGGFTVRYLAGPKQGLLIHFFAGTELAALFADRYTAVLPPRLQRTRREPPQPGQWSQWEAIWRKPVQ